MARTGKKRNSAMRWLMWPLLVGFLVLASLPVWFPWVLRPILNHFDLSYGNYQRLGWTHFSLNDVQGNWKTTQLQADHVKCVLPTTWVWQKFLNSTNSEPVLVLSNAVLVINESTNSPADNSGKDHSSAATLETIQQIGVKLGKYLPSAQLVNSKISLPSTEFSLSNAEWQQHDLRAQVRSSYSQTPLEFEARITSEQSFALSIQSKRDQTGLQGKFTYETNLWKWAGELSWMTNQIAISADFTTNGWWPAKAQLTAQQMQVPAEMLHLNGYHDLTTTLALNLVSNEFNLQATGFALPTASAHKQGLPPVQGVLRAHGNPNSFTLEKLQLESPFAQATMTNTLGIERTGKLMDQAAQLKLSLDLSRVPGMSMKGHVGGMVSVDLGKKRQPIAHFHLNGTKLNAFGLAIKSARLQGDFDWPELTLDTFKVGFDDGSEVSAHGEYNFASNALHEISWQANGDFLKSMVSGLNYSNFLASGTADGSLTNLNQTGQVTFEGLKTTATSLKPLQAKLDWHAEGWKLTNAQVQLAAGDSVLSANAAVDLSLFKQHGVNVRLNELSLSKGDVKVYALKQPCSLSFRQFFNGGKMAHWQLNVDHFDWAGAQKNFALTTRLDWPAAGTMQLNASHIALSDFTNFMQMGTNKISVPQMDIAANWSNGPVQLKINSAAEFKDKSGQTFSVQGKIQTGTNINIQELSFGSDLVPAVTLKGSLPFQIISSTEKNWLVPDYKAAINLTATSQTDTNGLLLPFMALGKPELSGAQFQAHATGTLESPTVQMQLGITNMHWLAETNFQIGPQVNQFKLDATLTPELFTLSGLNFNLDNQPVSATGKWPLPKDFWKNVWSQKASTNREWPDWRMASGQVKIQEAQLAALARYVPTLIASAGSLDMDLKLAQGGKLDGSLAVTNVSTRSFGSLPPLRDIAAQVHFDGTKAVLDQCEADLGGQPLHIKGQATFPFDGSSDYQVHLTGTNVPLVRSLEFLLRGDVDLDFQGKSGAPPTLSGKVKLRHGLYVRYLSDLFWSGPKRPTPHPPYFSITNQFLADWKLNLDVQGNRFLRVQTPVFSCLASADAKLAGTLETPVLTGSAQINSGAINFPFGTLQVHDSNVSLTGNDPRGPNLEFHASGTTYNYEIHLDVTGPADKANVVFSSTPPLNSEEILLLLTAGEVPQNQYTFSTQARASRLATFLGKDWLDRFTGDSGSEPRWTIKSGEYVSEAGKLTYSVEYRISKHWSIIGEYDQYDEYNANLKWRIISR